MSKIVQSILSPELTVSVELFPPKSRKGHKAVLEEVGRIQENMNVAFTSVTYGAGGSTRDGTLELVLELGKRYPDRVVAHLTCVGAAESELEKLMSAYKKEGMTDILALRGDIPEGMTKEQATAGGFHYAADLVRWLLKLGGFSSIGVAFFPEGHPETPDKSVSMGHFVEKVDVGGDYALSQFFYENHLYEEFRGEAESRGVMIAIAPGILPIRDIDQILRFAGLCGASVPAWVVSELEPFREDAEGFKEKSADLAATQIRGLEAMGARHVHIYCLNKSDILLRIAERLGWKKKMKVPD